MPAMHAFTIDVEEWFQVGAYEGVIDRADWPQCERRLDHQLRQLLEVLDQTGSKATLFWLGSVAEENKGLLRLAADAGHEIACHGWDHRRLFTLSRGEISADIARAKALLEDVSGHPVIGYRAPSFSLTPDVDFTYDILADLGFLYSSSLYAIQHDHYGAAHHLRLPFAPREGQALIELPMTTYRRFGRNWPVSGGGYFRLLPAFVGGPLFLAGARQLGQPGMFYMHPWEVDSDQPVIDTDMKTRFRHRVNLAHMLDKVTILLKQASFTSVAQAYGLPNVEVMS